MKLINYLLVALIFISSCKEDTEDKPILPNDYGSGLYIATDNGVSFYDGDTIKNQIYRTVNSTTLSNVERIKFKGTKAYILSDHNLYTANIKTFESKGVSGSFVNAVDFEFVSPDDRMFVVDRGDSKVKVVDLDRMEITSEIETGDITKPVFIVKYLDRSIVMNGGAEPDSLKDSTIVAIDYKDSLVSFADFMGSYTIGDNPNSAVWNSKLKVLCKGIYDPNDLTTKTQSSLVTVDDPLNIGSTTQTQILLGIYNANNLIFNNNENKYYFTASDGIYKMDSDGTGVTDFPDLVLSDVLYYQDEEYSQVINDTVTNYYNRNVLYINDSENSKNTIYKYDLDLDQYIDTIIVDGNVRDINFY